MVEPGLHAEMTKMNHLFDDNFRVIAVELEAKVESDTSKQKRLLQLQKELAEKEGQKEPHAAPTEKSSSSESREEEEEQMEGQDQGDSDTEMQEDGPRTEEGGKRRRGRPKKSASTKSKRKNVRKAKVARKVIKKVPLVFCSDINEFLEKVQNLRELSTLDNALMKVYVDEGQGRFTFSISVVEWTKPDCLAEGKGFKCTGVRRVFVLATSPCKETYDNTKVILEKLNFSQIFAFQWRLCGDLKFINTFVGIGPHSSSFPCFVCTWRRGTKEAGVKRKFSDILESFRECSSKKAKAKDHYRFVFLHNVSVK